MYRQPGALRRDPRQKVNAYVDTVVARIGHEEAFDGLPDPDRYEEPLERVPHCTGRDANDIDKRIRDG